MLAYLELVRAPAAVTVLGAVTVLSRGEIHGAARSTPIATTTLSAAVAAGVLALPVDPNRTAGAAATSPARQVMAAAAIAVFATTALRAGLDAARHPEPGAVRTAVRAGIAGLVPLHSALLARMGAVRPAAALLAVEWAAGRLGRRSHGDIT